MGSTAGEAALTGPVAAGGGGTGTPGGAAIASTSTDAGTTAGEVTVDDDADMDTMVTGRAEASRGGVVSTMCGVADDDAGAGIGPCTLLMPTPTLVLLPLVVVLAAAMGENSRMAGTLRLDVASACDRGVGVEAMEMGDTVRSPRLAPAVLTAGGASRAALASLLPS